MEGAARGGRSSITDRHSEIRDAWAEMRNGKETWMRIHRWTQRRRRGYGRAIQEGCDGFGVCLVVACRVAARDVEECPGELADPTQSSSRAVSDGKLPPRLHRVVALRHSRATNGKKERQANSCVVLGPRNIPGLDWTISQADPLPTQCGQCGSARAAYPAFDM